MTTSGQSLQPDDQLWAKFTSQLSQQNPVGIQSIRGNIYVSPCFFVLFFFPLWAESDKPDKKEKQLIHMPLRRGKIVVQRMTEQTVILHTLENTFG